MGKNKDSEKDRKLNYSSIHSEQHYKIPNWKTSDHDIVHRFSFKTFTSIHGRLAIEMKRCLQEADVP